MIVRTKVHATTAMFPGNDIRVALDKINAGVSEPYIGAISSEHVQLCPQNYGELTPALCDALRQDFPNMQLRPHANTRVLPVHVYWDASDLNDDTRFYFLALADRAHRLGAKAVSLHAGHRKNTTLEGLIDNQRRLQEMFCDVQVAIEGLYPDARNPQLVDTWAEYETLLRRKVPMAIDLSHLNIVAHKDGGVQDDLVRELLASPLCLEIHLSGNDGEKDSHDVLDQFPWWWRFLKYAGPNALLFSESNQLRDARRRRPQNRSVVVSA